MTNDHGLRAVLLAALVVASVMVAVVQLPTAAAAGNVAGTITDATGTPADGDHIRFVGPDSAQTVTDGSGAYSVYLDAAGTYRVDYAQTDWNPVTAGDYPKDGSADVYAIGQRSYTGGATGENFTVPTGHTLDVRVVAPDGTPIGDAVVSVGHEHEEAWAHGTMVSRPSDGFGVPALRANGTYTNATATTGFEVTTAEGGDIHLTVEPPGDRWTRNTTAGSYQVTSSRSLEFTLYPAVTVGGTVTYHDGTTASNVTLDFRPDRTRAHPRNRTTGENGRYEASLASGSYDAYGVTYEQRSRDRGVQYPKDGYADVYVFGTESYAANTSGVDRTVPEGHELDVTVVDQDGNPLPNASVTINQESEGTGVSARLSTNASGVAWAPGSDGAGLEVNGTVHVDVEKSGYDAESTEVTLDGSTGDRHLEVQLVQDGVPYVEQDDGSAGSDGRSTTRQLTLRTNTNRTFDGGTKYQLVVTNDDTGDSATLEVNGSFTLSNEGRLSFRLYEGDGGVTDPEHARLAHAERGFREEVGVRVVGGAIPQASDVTNFSMTLVDKRDGSTVSTDSRRAYVGYRGTISQNSTDGAIRLWVPRNQVPEDATVTLAVSDGDRPHEGNRSEYRMAYNGTGDSFEYVLDASELPQGDYAWEVTFEVDRWRVLHIRGTHSINEYVEIHKPRYRATILTGDVEHGDGTAAQGTVEFRGEQRLRPGLDSQGRYDTFHQVQDLPATGSYHLGYVQVQATDTGRNTLAADDGAPDVAFLRTVTDPGIGTTDLGTTTLPGASQVNVTVVDPSGDPVEGALVVVEGQGPDGQHAGTWVEPNATTADGLVHVRGKDHPGIELVGDYRFQVAGPFNSTQFASELSVRNVSVSGDRAITMTVNRTAVSPRSHDFGSVAVGASERVDVTVTNDGDFPWRAADTSIVGGDASQYVVVSGGGNVTLAPGESHTVTVEFAPSSAGSLSAALRFENHQPANAPPLEVPLSGTGETVSTPVATPTESPTATSTATEPGTPTETATTPTATETATTPTATETPTATPSPTQATTAPPTATPTATPTPTATDESPTETTTGVPGFGVVAAVLAVLAALVLVRRRD
jgi:PGF-CTERM protein